MPIVCFFGPDGSGKSTLVRALLGQLDRSGHRVRLSWMRGTHTFASLLAELLCRFTVFRGSDNPYYQMTVPRNLRRLWQLIEFASVIPIILLKFILPSALGFWVIAERYIPDFVTWVSLTTGDQNYPEKMEAKFLLLLSSKARVRIYVTAILEELLKRREGTDPKFLSNQLEFYGKMASVIHAKMLDTTHKSVANSLEEVLCTLDIWHVPKRA